MSTYSEFKKVARGISIPDELKRSFISNLFDLKPQVCATKYAVGLKIAQKVKEEEINSSKAGRVFMSSMENGLDQIRKEKASRKFLSYEFLNERGLDEVDLIVAATFASFDEKICCHKLIV